MTTPETLLKHFPICPRCGFEWIRINNPYRLVCYEDCGFSIRKHYVDENDDLYIFAIYWSNDENIDWKLRWLIRLNWAEIELINCYIIIPGDYDDKLIKMPVDTKFTVQDKDVEKLLNLL